MKAFLIACLVACGGGSSSSGPGVDGGIPGANNNYACTITDPGGGGTSCIGLEATTAGVVDQYHQNCDQQHGTSSSKCPMENLFGCCKSGSTANIQIDCLYNDGDPQANQRSMASCTPPAGTWSTTVPQ